MKKLFLIILTLFVFLPCFPQNQKPKLVVGIVIDQMRQDYIYRYWDTFGEDGFKKVVNQGFMLKNGHYNYIPTNTGPGHASVYTGTTPANHGIISNSWYEKESGKYVNCIEDTTVATVGAENSRGLASPHRMVSTTITDELKLASQGRSKVISVSIKDRGSILPAGHMADGAYWFDDATGNFVSSTFYMEKLPKWVNTFNKKKYAARNSELKWELLLPAEKYSASGPDDSPYEVVLGGKTSPTFPYDMKTMASVYSNFGFLNATPFGNQIVLDMALAALDGESLGKGTETDFLAVSFSSTDYAGHAFGPNSVEVQDMYLRLDKNIETLLHSLTDQVGEGNFTLFITSDHGVVDVPARLADHGIPAGYINRDLKTLLNDYLKGVLKSENNYVISSSNGQIFLDHSLLIGENLRQAEDLCAQYLRDLDGVYTAFSATEIRNSDFNGGGMKGLLTRGYNQPRSGDILYTMYPAYSSSGSEKGTGHGTGFTYDTHVPIIFYGTGIQRGHSVEYYTITDIAPTISTLLNIRFPSAATGQPIAEILK